MAALARLRGDAFEVDEGVVVADISAVVAAEVAAPGEPLEESLPAVAVSAELACDGRTAVAPLALVA